MAEDALIAALTLKDIAREAGVSLATVDRVLHNRPGVRPDTVRRVKETIARILDGVSADDESHAALRAAALASPDYAEGVSAFLERRSPRFG